MVKLDGHLLTTDVPNFCQKWRPMQLDVLTSEAVWPQRPPLIESNRFCWTIIRPLVFYGSRVKRTFPLLKGTLQNCFCSFFLGVQFRLQTKLLRQKIYHLTLSGRGGKCELIPPFSSKHNKAGCESGSASSRP